MKNQNKIAEQLRQLSRLYVNSQKYRNKFGNLLRSKFQYVEDKDTETEVLSKFKDMAGMEKVYEKKMKKLLPLHPWSEYLLGIKGVGTGIASSIIGELDGAVYGSIEKGKKVTKSDLKGYGREFERTSDLWAYAGYAVKDGKAVKPTHGEKCNWNKYLKLACYKFAENQIKQGDRYRKVYDDRKEFEQNNKELSKMHIHRRSMRYMIKKFLSDVNHDLCEKGAIVNGKKG